LCNAPCRDHRSRAPGAGAYLVNFFGRLYIHDDGCKKCKQLAEQMDRNGPEWCEENLDMIVGKLRENAAKRGLPFSEWLARGLVRRAIAWARG
jgi:hypothetical protein